MHIKVELEISMDPFSWSDFVVHATAVEIPANPFSAVDLPSFHVLFKLAISLQYSAVCACHFHYSAMVTSVLAVVSLLLFHLLLLSQLLFVHR